MHNKGDILLINFPFSDFKNFKLRPVLLWEDLWNDCIVMPITSNKINIFWEYKIKKDDINNLKTDSYLKLLNINTVDKKIIIWKLWNIPDGDLEKVSELFCKKFCRGL